ncbi:DedA family integral membrane protein [Escherichia coli]|uniref:DedA family integral membrane protein n=1 Tax=Escherichia coli TaxID=562 RepID=A0A376K3G3_ECOLX|nr:DedA family integral membrane protein [Escherichia coli]
MPAGRLDLLWLGWRFKKPLHRWSFLKKNKALLDKTEHALHQHSMFTILVGRFVGPTRPLVPMVAGMLDLPGGKIYYAEYYRLPAVATVLLPAGDSGGCGDRYSSRNAERRSLNGLLLATAVFLWVGGWLCWRLWRSGKATDRLSHYLSRGRLLWLTPLISAVGVVALVVLIRHPLMPMYIDILRKVVGVRG